MIFFTFNTLLQEAAVNALGSGGTMVIVGVAPETALMNISPAFMLNSRKIIGSVIGGKFFLTLTRE